MKTKKNPEYSIVVPVYNEVATLPELYHRLAQVLTDLDGETEVIFVNDGSNDGSGEFLNNLADKNNQVKVLHFANNLGHQIALTAGMDFASGNVITTIDADLQDPPEFIKEMLAKIYEGYDVVHAQRRTRAGETWFKLFTARFFYAFIRQFSAQPLVKNSGDFRAFTRPVLKAACSFRERHRFLRGNFVLLGFKQCAIQYDRAPRYKGESKYPLKKMVKFALDAILGFSSAPIKLVSVASFFIWGISLIYLVKALVDHFIFKVTVPGWTSIIILMGFYTGLILFCLAVIGVYVGRIFEQGQKRPLYWLSDIRNIDISLLRDMDITDEILISNNILKAKSS